MSSVIDVADSLTPQDNTPANDETPGALLKAAREKAGLSASDIAKELNLSVEKLEALEHDQYEKLASEVFAQGYLRRYGKLVKVDDNMLVSRFSDYLARKRAAEREAAAQQEPPPSAPSVPPRWLLPAGIFVLAIIILVFIFIGNAGNGGSERPASGGEASSGDTASVAEAPPPAETEPEPSGEIVEQSPDESSPARVNTGEVSSIVEPEPPVPEPAVNTASPLENTAEDSGPGATTDRADSSMAETNQGGSELLSETDPGELSFVFSEDCWVEVADASGTVIHADLAEAGESLTLEGEAPFSVMLGNARGVSLSYQGEAVPVRPRAGNRTARLEVGG